MTPGQRSREDGALRRLARVVALLMAAAFLAAPAERLPTPDALRDAGWAKGAWSGIEPARFEALPDGGLRIVAAGQGSFVWRAADPGGHCLSWRWRVDAGPPPTPLDRRGGDDRAIALTVGFDGWPPDAGFLQRTKHALAQAVAGDHRLPRSMIVYVWGGTGEEPRPFASLYMHGLGQVFVLRPATTEGGRWFEEKIDVARAWTHESTKSASPPADSRWLSAAREPRSPSCRAAPSPGPDSR